MEATSMSVAERDAAFLRDVLAGLSACPKRLPCKYLYNRRGSELFDRICELEDYYLTRTETEILTSCIDDIRKRLCRRPVVFELGSGSSVKTRILLDNIENIRAYVPMDISGRHLEASVANLRTVYPELPIHPLVADYTRSYRLPEAVRETDCVVAFFPGSTIGNFRPEAAIAFLRRVGAALPPRGMLLIGVDLKKDRDILLRAYDDSEGVTAEFNKNLLRRANEELGADFPVDAFEHLAVFNPVESRMEMYLVATEPCTVHIDEGHRFTFERGERIHTENSYKYSLSRFGKIARAAGFDVDRVWTDPADWFSVQLLRKRA